MTCELPNQKWSLHYLATNEGFGYLNKRASGERLMNSSSTQMLRRQAGPPIPPHTQTGSQVGSTQFIWKSFRALKLLPSIQENVVEYSLSRWRVRVKGKSRFKEYIGIIP